VSAIRAVGDSPTAAPGHAVDERTLRVAVRAPAPVAAVRRIASELRVHPLLAATLWARGFRTDVAKQLAPALELARIPALEDAAARIATAIERRERIVIHGDYDADGVTATALLTLALRALGANATPFIPDRLSDGYGVHPDRVDEHAARADLFITVDCGISNVAEVRALRARGVDVIVTDHHHLGVERPDALIVHPSDGQGCDHLTGAGVAFHLVWALHQRLGLDAPVEYSDVAALGTVADVAPLLGANRALVRAGLAQMADTARPGLRAMVSLAKLQPPLTARQLAFVLAPRLNAAGRLGHAGQALELLMTAEERRGRVLATLLEGLNDERRRIQATMLERAIEIADGDDRPALVLTDPEWHPGVMGIVASNVVERYHRPVFVIAGGKGSVRSVPGVSAVEALAAAQQHLIRWGGHSMAAGFAIHDDQIEAFREAICAFVGTLTLPAPSLAADALLHPSQVDDDLFAALQALEPYGEGHEEPRFAIAAPLEQVGTMGPARGHLQVVQAGVRGVGWGLGHVSTGFRVGEVGVSVATIARNTWRERTSVELRLAALTRLDALAIANTTRPDSASNGRLHIGQPSAASESLLIDRLSPTNEDPLAPLSTALLEERRVVLALGAHGPMQVRQLASAFPRLADARRAFVFRSRGRPWPWDGDLAERMEAILRELDLVDERGRARAGRRVDPYTAPTLLASLIARYALETLATLLETLPAADAARAVEALVGATDMIA